jgi:hypothetical protein
MFPIPSGQTLSFIDIADYWSREINPSASPHELRDTISKAWWRGELVAANGPSRVNLVRALYSKCADSIAFAIPGVPDPPCSRLLDDGGVEVYLLPRNRFRTHSLTLGSTPIALKRLTPSRRRGTKRFLAFWRSRFRLSY